MLTCFSSSRRKSSSSQRRHRRLRRPPPPPPFPPPSCDFPVPFDPTPLAPASAASTNGGGGGGGGGGGRRFALFVRRVPSSSARLVSVAPPARWDKAARRAARRTLCQGCGERASVSKLRAKRCHQTGRVISSAKKAFSRILMLGASCLNRGKKAAREQGNHSC